MAQPLEGAGGERGASYLPLQVGGDVSDLDLSAPAKTKPWVTVTGGQRLPEAFWEREGETLRRHPASRAACCRSPAVPSITWWLSVEKPKRTSVEEAPGGERRFQPRVVPPRGIARAPKRQRPPSACPDNLQQNALGQFWDKTHTLPIPSSICNPSLANFLRQTVIFSLFAAIFSQEQLTELTHSCMTAEPGARKPGRAEQDHPLQQWGLVSLPSYLPAHAGFGSPSAAGGRARSAQLCPCSRRTRGGETMLRSGRGMHGPCHPPWFAASSEGGSASQKQSGTGKSGEARAKDVSCSAPKAHSSSSHGPLWSQLPPGISGLGAELAWQGARFISSCPSHPISSHSPHPAPPDLIPPIQPLPSYPTLPILFYPTLPVPSYPTHPTPSHPIPFPPSYRIASYHNPPIPSHPTPSHPASSHPSHPTPPYPIPPHLIESKNH